MVTDAILDTSILVDLLRAFQPATEWFAGLGRQRVAITPVVWMETVQGATDGVRRAQAIRFLRQFRIEHPTQDAVPLFTTNLKHFEPLPSVDVKKPY
jgi:predicted nucleic acid-binding protein